MSFQLADVAEENHASTIGTDDFDEFAELRLDQMQLKEDVENIADGDFFKKLASQANEFRQQKGP